MIDPAQIIANALAMARVSAAARLADSSDLTSVLQKQRAALDAQLADLATLSADAAADVAAIDAKASAIGVVIVSSKP